MDRRTYAPPSTRLISYFSTATASKPLHPYQTWRERSLLRLVIPSTLPFPFVSLPTHTSARAHPHTYARRSIRQALELPPSSTPQFYHVRRSREDWGNPSPRWINKNRGRKGICRRNLSTRYRLPDLRNALEKIEDISLVYQECTSQSWKSGRDERYFQPIPLSLPLRLVFYTFSFSFPFLSSFSSPLSFSLSFSTTKDY